MDWKNEFKYLFWSIVLFFVFYFLPTDSIRFQNAIFESLELTKWYVREHIVLCLIPALFIAGAIAVFVSQDSVMRYFGSGAKKILAYSVASVSGTILAVCSCTVLPLFAGIYKRGAGLGPAIAFLYSGPAINALAIILTAKVLGFELGAARAVGAVLFSIIIGLLMSFIFKDEEDKKVEEQKNIQTKSPKHPVYKTVLYFASMTAILVFANWGKADTGFFKFIYNIKWEITSFFAVLFGAIIAFWFNVNKTKIIITTILTFILWLFFKSHIIAFTSGFIGLSWAISTDKGKASDWFYYSWDLSKQIFPLLIAGVLVSGFLLGRPGNEGIIPSRLVSMSVGGNSLWANLFSSVVGAFMYFATLTEVPILQGLIGAGMGKGPALALLLAGPALSLPNMLVLKQIMGIKKTVIYVLLVIVMSTITGMIYGRFF